MYVRVFERPGLSQDIEEPKREIKELERRLAHAKEKIEKPFNPFLGEAYQQGVLKQAGLTKGGQTKNTGVDPSRGGAKPMCLDLS